MLIETTEKIRNITSAVNSIVVSVGLVVGGYWAYHKFDILGEINKSKLEQSKLDLENSRLDKQNKLFDRNLNEFPAIQVSVNASQLAAKDNENYLVHVKIKISNVGSKTVKMKYSPDSFAISPIKFNETGNADFGKGRIFHMPSSDKPEIPLTAAVLRAKDTASLSTVIRVSDPGIYLVRFYAKQSAKEEQKIIDQFGKSTAKNYRGVRWGGSGVVVVKKGGE